MSSSASCMNDEQYLQLEEECTDLVRIFLSLNVFGFEVASKTPSDISNDGETMGMMAPSPTTVTKGLTLSKPKNDSVTPPQGRQENAADHDDVERDGAGARTFAEATPTTESSVDPASSSSPATTTTPTPITQTNESASRARSNSRGKEIALSVAKQLTEIARCELASLIPDQLSEGLRANLPRVTLEDLREFFCPEENASEAGQAAQNLTLQETAASYLNTFANIYRYEFATAGSPMEQLGERFVRFFGSLLMDVLLRGKTRGGREAIDVPLHVVRTWV